MRWNSPGAFVTPGQTGGPVGWSTVEHRSGAEHRTAGSSRGEAEKVGTTGRSELQVTMFERLREGNNLNMKERAERAPRRRRSIQISDLRDAPRTARRCFWWGPAERSGLVGSVFVVLCVGRGSAVLGGWLTWFVWLCIICCSICMYIYMFVAPDLCLAFFFSPSSGRGSPKRYELREIPGSSHRVPDPVARSKPELSFCTRWSDSGITPSK